MLTASIRRKILLVLLAAVLTIPWPASAGTWESPRLGRVRTNLDLLDRPWGFLLGVWTKAGCNIDPNGREGCNIDPNGIPQPPINQTKEGCHIDPNGVPRCTP